MRAYCCPCDGIDLPKSMDETLEFYNRNADSFIENTLHADMQETQDRFLRLVKPGGCILDFGCGSGRDARSFLLRGYRVDAVDGSAELVRKASEQLGIPVQQLRFQDLSEVNYYDGIWACASILHLPKRELKYVMPKMTTALHDGGVIYASFKYGTFEGERNGRYFTDFTEETIREFLPDMPTLQLRECWITADVRPGREDGKWLNLLLRKRRK